MAKRREMRNLVGRFRGGKLAPVMATAVKAGESGMLSQAINMELDPIPGRLLSPITAEFIAVFVPLQALVAASLPNDPTAGLTEVIRKRMMDGQLLLGYDSEHELSKRMGVNPRSIGGHKRVVTAVRYAHNIAVNFLRRRLYIYAAQVPMGNFAVTPALLSSTVLQRLNGVLDPDDHVNGEVELRFAANARAPVSGIGVKGTGAASSSPNQAVTETDGVSKTYPFTRNLGNDGGAVDIRLSAASAGKPEIYAELANIPTGGVSLVDFYNAQSMDRVVRALRKIADADPVLGEEAALRFAYGLEVETETQPFVLYEGRETFGGGRRVATDGTGMIDEVSVTEKVHRASFTVPVPRTEMGGVIVTFATVKPDEKLQSVPHPILSAPWTADNMVADELKLDPVPVVMRDLYSDVAAADEATVAFYTGLNELKRTYIDYGFNRQVDAATVENKTAIWQIAVPASVTPQNVIYPQNLSHYPFADQNAEVCTYNVESMMTLTTPMFFGPTPVETVAVVDANDIFDQD